MAIPQSAHSESTPLLPGKPPKKPCYRPRPLWLVPFAIVSSLVRGMTLAPRLEIYTQLACSNLYGDHKWNHTQHMTLNISSDIANIPLYASIDPLGPHLHPYSLFPEPGTTYVPNPNHQLVVNDDDDTDNTEDPRRIPSSRCVSDPEVQASAARLQTIMITTMGLLSALTTGWWGHFSERHGRTTVLALSTFGLFFTDLVFILASTPTSPFSKHGHKLLLLSPIVEGLLGGSSTVQSGTSAYLSDCTSSGSRAYIFSRFAGVTYLGFSIGPVIGGWLIRNPISWIGGSSIPGRQSVTSVFWVAMLCSFINLLLITFVFPESLDKEKKERAMIAYKKSGALGKGKTRERALTLSSGDPGGSSSDEEDDIEEVTPPRQEERESGIRSGVLGIISQFLSPLAVFLPVMVLDPSGLGKRRDWSLTLLAGGLFGYLLSYGVFQIKYLYARHTYDWGAEQLSYYISFMGGSRAMFLLFLLPTLISFIKPKPLTPGVQKGKGKPPILSSSIENGNNSKSTHSSTVQQPQPEQRHLQKGKKPKPTRAQLGQEIGFDLVLTRFSLMIDIVSQSLVILFPSPAFTDDHISLMQTDQGRMSFAKSQALFVMASSLTSLGSGVIPAVHSLALCMLQVRALDAAAACSVDGEDASLESKEEGTGALFGAFAVLQAVGQAIVGPMIFGLVYSETVATFPKAVFAVAAALLVYALTMVLCVKNPVRPAYVGRSNRRNDSKQGRDIERGRSRVSKDLRGGAIIVNDDGNYGSTDESGASSS